MDLIHSRFWTIVLLLLTVMAACQVQSARKESEVWDEDFELAAGYSYLKTGELRINLEQPPVAKVLAGLPLLFLAPSVPIGDPSWITPNDVNFGHAFLYNNRIRPGKLLIIGRISIILLTAGLGILIAAWTRRRFGEAPALLAVTLLAFDPNFIAHGHYATTDLAATAFIFAACLAWDAFLASRRVAWLGLAGVMLGLAISTKFSALFLLPAYWMIWWWQQPRPFSGRRLFFSVCGAAVVAGLVIVVVYAPEARLFLPSWAVIHPGPPLAENVDRTTPVGDLLYWAGRIGSLQLNSFYRGLNAFAQYDRSGNASYLLGNFSDTGWWYYFPVVFLVKTPTADLLLFGLVVCAWLVICLRDRLYLKWPAMPLSWATLLAPAILYFAATMATHVDLGVRHLLPFYPFFLIALAAGFFTFVRAAWPRRAPVLLVLICSVLVIESVWAYPNYLSFFNTVSGGTWRGPHYLLDSNIDWGQDLKKFRAYTRAHPGPQYCLEYFGNADLGYYGMDLHYLPKTHELEERRDLNCIAGISATLLYDLHLPRGYFAWLRERKPMDRVGGIWIYDLRKPQ